MSIAFKVNGKYTFVTISSMCVTVRAEITITRQDGMGRYLFKLSKKRKEFYVPLDLQDTMVFEGHQLPFVLDSETSRFMGNARFNFVTDTPDTLKAFILEKCLNGDPQKYSQILVTSKDRSSAKELFDPTEDQ